ncbi:universal stress protein [Arcobacter sp. KX21116]|jgi:nucleotide-binding universal stress UspA family protein|uniref:universal stress protein n=1 Tax=Arcobacter iocasae TaxID=2906515 RepID=UPI0035D4BC68|tara:strand:+ start:46124 stop:46972 length:849 start_codon:yes stop_codon:yes gene_type:complete
MEYKRIFFPLGGGGELRSRIHGALLIGKYFKAHLEIFKSQARPSQIMKFDNSLPDTVLKELNAMTKDRLKEEINEHEIIFKEEIKKVGSTSSSKSKNNTATATIITGEGFRSKLIEEESKYCDLVIVSTPHEARITATFETAVTKSGKPALMFPRKMKKFSAEKILIGWNNSPEAARAVSESIPLLKNAKKVHIISSKKYGKDLNQISKLQNYLEDHGIDTSFEIVKTTKTPGQALLTYAKDGKFDLIVAGAFGHRGLRELMFGGTTKYMLKNSDIPIFMAH